MNKKITIVTKTHSLRTILITELQNLHNFSKIIWLIFK